jgi:hypothetical protein
MPDLQKQLGLPSRGDLDIPSHIRAPMLWLMGYRSEEIRKVVLQNHLKLLSVLRRHELTPIFYWWLAKEGMPDTLVPEFLEGVRHDYAHALKAASEQEEEARKLMRSLTEAARLEVILLKGSDLRLRVYPDPATRPMADLDILVPPEQAGQARSILTGLGYRSLEPNPRPGFRERFAHAAGLQPPPGFSLHVDLHWEIREGHGFYRLPWKFIKPRLQEVVFHNLTLKVLSPEHLLIHLCLHTYWEFLIWRQFLDLALAVQHLPVNWGQFANDVRACRCQVPVSWMLDWGHRLQPDLWPSPTALGLTDFRPGWAERLVVNGGIGPLIPYVAFFVHHPRADWLPFLSAKLWPDREFLVAKFGSDSRGRYLRQFVRKFRNRAGDPRDSGKTMDDQDLSLHL